MKLALPMLVAGALAAAPCGAAAWCLGMQGIGPVRGGMSVEDVLALADFPGQERKSAAQACWYLHYDGGGADFDVMIVDGRVARVELKGRSRLRTISGAHIGSSEDELRSLYAGFLAVSPGKYDATGHVFTVRAPGGDYGLRFETSRGKVTAIQAGPWEHLNYVEGCG